ncbi:MAG: glycosyltransferase family 2 protein [Roseburia sp.]|nr:glycosyltransferase family 2 protein [Roseburia sp.]
MKLSLVVPCYNEAENVRLFTEKVREHLADLDYEIIFVNDGSKDDTIKELKNIKNEKKENITIINFSRNFGKEAGIYAGFQHAKGDYVTVIDADLQQPLEVAREMYDFLEGHEEYDAVAAYQDVRKEGRIITAFKDAFYKIINKLCDIELYANASDFRCMRRTVVEAILSMSEYHRFSKGIFAWVGFDTYYRPYEVQERNAGTSSWSFWSLLKYAMEGVISFSTKPLKVVISAGVFTSVMAILYMIVVIVQKLVFGIEIPGYPTIIVLILLIGGIQLTVMGIIGEYLAKVHIEVKGRPIYIAKEVLHSTREEG